MSTWPRGARAVFSVSTHTSNEINLVGTPALATTKPINTAPSTKILPLWQLRTLLLLLENLLTLYFPLISPTSRKFVHINNLRLICRAHQLVHEGYKFMFDEKLVTVWSAPNYCYRCGNIASIMVFKDANTREPKLFRAVPDSERVIPPRTTTPYFL